MYSGRRPALRSLLGPSFSEPLSKCHSCPTSICKEKSPPGSSWGCPHQPKRLTSSALPHLEEGYPAFIYQVTGISRKLAFPSPSPAWLPGSTQETRFMDSAVVHCVPRRGGGVHHFCNTLEGSGALINHPTTGSCREVGGVPLCRCPTTRFTVRLCRWHRTQPGKGSLDLPHRLFVPPPWAAGQGPHQWSWRAGTGPAGPG